MAGSRLSFTSYLSSFLSSLPFFGSSNSENTSSTTMSEPYEPSIADVLVVKAMLTKGICKSLPRELVDLVLDYAEYWPHMTVHESFNNQCVARGRSNRENRLIVGPLYLYTSLPSQNRALTTQASNPSYRPEDS